MLEAPIEDYLVTRVERDYGGMALKGVIAGRKFIDRICILPGARTIFIECKRPKGGRKEPHQIEIVKRLTELGHEAYFLKTKDEIDFVLARADTRTYIKQSKRSAK